MKIAKKSGDILLTQLNQKEVFGLLKCQIPMHLVFMDQSYAFATDKTLSIGERVFDDGVQKLLVNDEACTYKGLIEKIGQNMHGLSLGILFLFPDFKANEALIAIAGTLKKDIVDSAVYIAYEREVFVVVNRPFANGDSDKLFYYESNNSLLAFIENGPVLVTDNPHLTSVNDILCN
jgi:hypothetical protein